MLGGKMPEVVKFHPIAFGAMAVSLVSALLTWALFKHLPGRQAWLLPLAAPFFVAYSLYWWPVWMGSKDVDQYGAWALLVITPWYLAGAGTSACVVFLRRSLRR